MKKGRHLTICSVLRVMFHIKIRLRQEETNLQTSTTTESCFPSLPFNNKTTLASSGAIWSRRWASRGSSPARTSCCCCPRTSPPSSTSRGWRWVSTRLLIYLYLYTYLLSFYLSTYLHTTFIYLIIYLGVVPRLRGVLRADRPRGQTRQVASYSHASHLNLLYFIIFSCHKSQ